ncbi:MAG: bifunctional acetate--CoA ligase family protein/GNAT family N-acetyltransferase [Simkaniaceae bacterium]|nr:bifunctional acetate--CoA ligase family protein/GNAT family N-acetyltransferase [Simkaniaceae bacterium]
MAEKTDPSQNFIRGLINPLDSFFNPKSIAVIGATEKPKSVGCTLTTNLIDYGYKGHIYPVNPKYETLFNLTCYPSLSSIKEPVDLAIIITPAHTTPPLINECVKHKVSCIIIISAGFKELGEEGEKLEKEILHTIQGTQTRIIGPNCLGLMNPHSNLNASFAADIPLKGNLAFISQSGAMCTSILDWSLKEKIGFSSFISIGSMADIGWGDLIDYFGHDPKTDIILLYMETIGDARAFLSAAKKVALTKPIILIKAGSSEEAAKAAASHTGSLAGSDDAFNSAIHRVGALRVTSISTLFSIAQVLAKQPIPNGPHLTIITNAGGPGVLATDATIFGGGELTELSPETIKQLNQILPAAWSHSNPVDILGDATPDTYAKAIEVVVKDPHSDGILVILTPQSMTDPTQTARIIAKYAKSDKPIYASWMGGESLEKGINILSSSGIPHFEYPDEACHIFGKLWRYRNRLKALYETPHLREGNMHPADIQTRYRDVDRILTNANREKRVLLTEYESKQVLDAYGIPTVKTELAATKEEAINAARHIGYPVVLKLHSETITHKTDVGGVKLNLYSDEAVAHAFDEIQESVTAIHGLGHFQGVSVQEMVKENGYEILIGSNDDPQFGPILVFGTGGALVEVFRDRSLAIPPLNSVLAHQLMSETKIYKALQGVRGKKPIDFNELERILIVFSQLIIEHSWIKECDINPLLVSENRIVALDARFVLHENESQCVVSALHPYPHLYIERISLKDSSNITLRPIRPEDEAKMKKFHEELSENTVRSRFLKFMALDKRIAHERLVQVCSIDYDREMRFVAETDEGDVVAVGSYTKQPNSKNAEFKLIITDRAQGKGLGKKLLQKLIETARRRNIDYLFGIILNQNTILLKICEDLGFEIAPLPEEQSLLEVKLKL